MDSGDQPFLLRDAIDANRSALEYTHKMWTYFQAVVIGAAAFAWTGSEPRTPLLLTFVTIGVLVFGVPNGRLVYFYQRSACVAAEAIRAYWASHRDDISIEFRDLNMLFSPTPARLVAWMYAGLLGSAIAAIWARSYLNVPAP